jgi:inhibitor of KinA sporulation pathway (predicted exonuclease)
MAKKKLDCILVVDLEATCWAGAPPEGQESEIIEIGLCVLDVASGRRLENPSLLVRPECSTVSDYCTQLTTLTQEEVEAGMSLAEACHLLRETYHARERTWASFGDYDRWQMQKQCQAQGIEYPFGRTHINVKNLLALVHHLPREVPLDEAMAMMGFPLEGTHHRGGDDAWNIARLLGQMLLRAREA